MSSSSPASTKPPSVASFAQSRKSRGSVFEEKRGMSMKDVLVWKKITRRWHDRVMERQNRGGFCWWDHDGTRRRGRKPNLEKEPTYRMEPKCLPPVTDLIEIIKSYLEERFRNQSYSEDPNAPKQITMSIADEIKEKLKSCEAWPDRYKCICYVTMGQKTGQGVRVSSRCAWDERFDRNISYTYQNEHLFCVVTAFAIYCE